MAAAAHEAGIRSRPARPRPGQPADQWRADRSFEKRPSPRGASPSSSAARVGQPEEQLPLVLVEVGRRVDLQVDEEVAPAASLETGYAVSLQLEHGAALGAGDHRQVLGVVERLEGQRSSECRHGHRDVHLRVQIDARAFEDFVGFDGDVHEERAVRSSPEPGGTVPGQAKCGAVVDACGDVDGQGAVLHPAAFTAAFGAGVVHLLPDPLAARAGRRGDHLAEDRLADPTDLAGPLALGTADRRGARRRAGSPAGVAMHRGVHLHLLLDPEDGVTKGEAQHDLRVGPRDRAGAAPARRAAHPPHPAEEGVEEVREASAEGVAGRTWRTDRTRRRRRTGRSGRVARDPSVPRRRG